jgi:predicted DNA-binding transcriptional regulator YafY
LTSEGDNVSKISNAIRMALMLSSGRKYSIDELSSELEVSHRMIRTYKDELEKAGIYIDSIRGQYGGYVLDRSVAIPNSKFIKNDTELLEDIIRDTSDENKKQLIRNFLNKVNSFYLLNKQESSELIENALSKYNIISKAIKEKRKLQIVYYSYNKGENERIIRPYDMFLFQNGWGLAAFCEKKQDFRHFELNRISNINIINDYF